MQHSNDSNEGSPAPRLSVRLPARVSTVDPETDPFTGKSFFRTSEERSANVSETGLFLAMTDTIPPGRRVLVEMELPGGQIVQLMGRIAWTRTQDTAAREKPAGELENREPGVGIEFTGAHHPEDRRALDRFLARSLTQKAPAPPNASPSTGP